MKKRLLSIITALALCLALLPATALAASDPSNYVFDISEGGVTIGSGTDSGTLKVTYGGGTVKDNISSSQAITVTGSTAANNITVTDGVSATIILDNLTIDVTGINTMSAVNLDDAGACTIQLVGTNTLKAGEDRPGIFVPATNQTTFNGTGSLNVTGGKAWPGIGRMDTGNILIESGTIVSRGGFRAAGIGGSWGHTGGTITITGGTVTAIGNGFGAGIGGGATGDGSGTKNADFSTGSNGSAVIFASSISDQSGKDGWSGIIFEGDLGAVYGNQALTSDLTIPEGKTLTIPENTTLTIPAGVTLTVYGTINSNNGNSSMTNNGTLIVGPGASVPALTDGSTGESIKLVSSCTFNFTDDVATEGNPKTARGDGWSWTSTWNGEKAVNTLTLSGLKLHAVLENSCDDECMGAITLPENTTVVLEGKNTVELWSAEYEFGTSCGIACFGDLTVEGDGTLNVTISDAFASSEYSYGICAVGAMTVNSGRICASGVSTLSGAQSIGIFVQDLIVNGGTVTGNGGKAYLSSGIACAVFEDDSGGNIIVTGGSVNATGGDGEEASYGIYCEAIYCADDYSIDDDTDVDTDVDMTVIQITGGTVNAEGGATDSSAYTQSIGIYVEDGNMTVTGGKVTATGGNAHTDSTEQPSVSCGICLGGFTSATLTVSGDAVVTANGGTADGGDYSASCGIYTDDCIIQSGRVAAAGGEAPASCGISTNGLKMNSGSLLAQTTAQSNYAAKGALSVEPDLTDYASYQWRADAEGVYTVGDFVWNDDPYDTYVEIVPAYKVTFDANEGAVSTGTATCSADGKLATLPTPTRDGYTFDGWFTEKTGGTAVTTQTVFNGNTTIYAHWTANTYTVTLNTNGGTILEGNVTEYTYGVGAALPAKVIRSGYRFIGWYDNEACRGESVTEITTTDIGDKTFYAAWTAIPVTPTYPPMIEDAGNGSVIVSPKSPAHGVTVTVTPKPDEGYEVDEVVITDKNGNPVEVTDNGDGTYTFKQPSGKVTITVTFKETETEPEKDPVKDCDKDGTCPASKFTDVKMDWTHDGIHYCVENGLMQGEGNGRFNPEGQSARAMLVTVLYRLEGEPEVGENGFSDVPEGEWYTDAVTWAAENKIVEGYDGRFDPTGDITREQFATILYRYAVYKGYDVSVGEDTNILSFEDAEEISSWAKDAMQWAVGAGLFEGKGENNLDPTGEATRAEMATILYRFCENVAK